MLEHKFNRNYKDSIFRLLFNDPERAAELYYAFFKQKCDPKSVRLLTLDETLSRNFINDLAFVINDKTLVVSEHQSTLNVNMPLRMAIYFGRLYEKYLGLDQHKGILYRDTLIKIPSPEFIMLYNGDKNITKNMLKLSDAFNHTENTHSYSMELTVRVYDINKNSGSDLFTRSENLLQYADFVATVKQYVRLMGITEEAFKTAVDDCVNRNILRSFLSEHGGDIVSILESEFNIDDFAWAKFQDGREEGIQEGIREGIQESKLDIAQKMFQMGLELSLISNVTGLSINEIKKINAQNN